MTKATIWACPTCQATNGPGLLFCWQCDTWRPDRDPQHNGGIVTVYSADLVDRLRQITIEYEATLEDAANAGVDQIRALRAKIKNLVPVESAYGELSDQLARAENDHNDLTRRLGFVKATLKAAADGDGPTKPIALTAPDADKAMGQPHHGHHDNEKDA
jgi:hypothetical protein